MEGSGRDLQGSSLTHQPLKRSLDSGSKGLQGAFQQEKHISSSERWPRPHAAKGRCRCPSCIGTTSHLGKVRAPAWALSPAVSDRLDKMGRVG